MIQASNLLQQGRNNKTKVISAFEGLKEKGVVLNCDVDEHKKGRAAIEIKYTVKAAADFIKEQKASNKRANGIEVKLVDK